MEAGEKMMLRVPMCQAFQGTRPPVSKDGPELGWWFQHMRIKLEDSKQQTLNF